MADSSSIRVAIRCRPLSTKENGNLALPSTMQLYSEASLSGPGALQLRPAASIRKIVRVLDDRVLIFDPLDENPMSNLQRQLLGPNYKKKKDMRFCFDKVFDEDAQQQDVYDGIAKDLIDSVLTGYNSTVFAYGATGCGKTHTISGTPEDPGIIFLLMKDLFDRIQAKADESTVELSISYLEIYNEQIRDLLALDQTPFLTLREGDKSRIIVPGLSEHAPRSAEEVITLIHQGNANRSTNHTEANATSSRSHAVLSVNIKQRARTADISEDYSLATLSVIDLAGSERASVTKNKGERLLEGANINRSLLALGNCINALCDPRRRAHVPYRDSKLTRLLKHSLGGNCRTAMIVCVSPSSQHYDETHNTLVYANRAKQIKTKATKNIINVDRHVSQYVKIIFELRAELASRKQADADRDEIIRSSERALRNQGMAEVQKAVQTLRSSHENLLTKMTRAAQAKSELDCLESIRPILLRWRKDAFYKGEDTATEAFVDIKERIDSFISSLTSRGKTLLEESQIAINAQAMHEANVASLKRRLVHPEASQIFDAEIKTAELTLQGEVLKSRELGLIEGSKAQSRLLITIFDARSRLVNLQDLDTGVWQSAVRQMDQANQKAFEHLAGRQYEAASLSLARPAVIVPDIVSMKALPSPAKSQYRSPRKGSRSGLKSSIIGSPRKRAASKIEKKSVVWKDEAGEGWELEEEAQPITITDAAQEPVNIFSPDIPPASSSDLRASLRPIHNHLSTGFLGRNRSNAKPTLAGVAEDLENTPPRRTSKASGTTEKDRLGFLRSDPYRAPMSELGNVSMSSDNSSFGEAGSSVSTSKPRPPSIKRLATSRRSSVGPLRSVKKSRRVSYVPAVETPNSADLSVTVTSANRSRPPGRAPRTTLPSPKHSPVKKQRGSSMGLGGRTAGRASLAPTASPIWR